jgi:DnaJ-class molecular chaperone
LAGREELTDSPPYSKMQDMATVSDYYTVLQVDPQAEQEVIDAAYRRLAAKYHPDVNGGSAEATERMKLLNEAHEVLCDPIKRKAYDRGRAVSRQQAAGTGGFAGGLRIDRIGRDTLIFGALIVFALLASRFGTKIALFMVGALIFIGLLWLFQRRAE